MAEKAKFHAVKRSAGGRTWDVVDSLGRLVEGGFFEKAAAEEAMAAWEKDAERVHADWIAGRID